MTTYLAEKNPHKRDAEVTFEPVRHAYTIAESNALVPPTSVTTLTYRGVWPEFDSYGNIRRILESDDYISGVSKYSGMSHAEIQRQWDTSSLEARVEGTRLHDEIERYYNRGAVAEGEASFAAVVTSGPQTRAKKKRRLSDEEMKHDKVAEEKAISALSSLSAPISQGGARGVRPPDWRQFVAWAEAPEQAHLVPYRTEWRIFSRLCNVAGSVDMVFYNKKTHAFDIYDWKRSKEIKRNGFGKYAIHPLLKNEAIPDANYYKYSLQLATYKYILESEYELPYPIGELWLVRMDGDEKCMIAEAIEAADMSEAARRLMEDRWR